ncbi:MAG TPA: sulfite exporter TauE/SafE family protein, partial [Acidimicrobiia bacterium]|nr:sulfite exporter TauE/SafE family protein [Acidimicrobiia bacterium]
PSAGMPVVLEIVLGVLVGMVAGLLSGMFGIGGAVLSTPAIRVLGATALQAIGSTLPSILPSSVSGSLRYQRERMIRARVVVWTSVFGVPASVIGSRLSDAVPGNGHVLMLLTAALVGYTAYRTAFPSTTQVATALRDEWWRLAIIGVAAGTLSGLLGIGGGILMVPAFSAWVGLPLKETIATSLACVGIFAIPGTLTHWYLGHINWTFALALAVGVIPGARIGAHLTINTADRTLRYTVGAVLGAIALIYAVGELIAWLH